MFCRNCGKELTGAPEFCTDCGAKPMASTSFCPGCGAPTTPMTEVCPKCGAMVARKAPTTGGAWMPITGGILDLVVGVPSLIIAIVCAAFAGALGGFASWFTGWLGAPIGLLGTLICGPAIVLSIVAIIGGIFAIRKRAWGFALAGAICGFVVGLPLVAPAILLGIPAIVFTALGKSKFE